MLEIRHRGINVNLDMDQTGLTGDIEADKALAYTQSMKAGRIAGIDSNGKAQLADGSADSASIQMIPIGFIINDAAGYFFENVPALASKIIPVIMGNCVIVTDQIDTTLTFTPNDVLYVGTGAKIGLVTNVASTSGYIIGVAGSSASSAAPELLIYRA